VWYGQRVKEGLAVTCPRLWVCVRRLCFDSDVEIVVISEGVVLSGQTWPTSIL
jgi:hypothetical protein